MIRLFNETFEVGFHLYIGEKEYGAWRAAVIKLSEGSCVPDEDSGELYGSCYCSELWFHKPTQDTLIHEISHCVDMFMLHIGSACTETRAYVTTWMHREVRKALRKQKRKVKK